MPRSTATPLTRGERTRLKLRNAAAARFATQGFHETKVSEIVADVGLTQPTFYSYYPSKDVAYEALVEEFRSRLHALTQSMVIVPDDAEHDLIDQVSSSFKRFLDFLAEDPQLTEIGFRQLPTALETRRLLLEWLLENMSIERTYGLVSEAVPSEIIVRCFVGMVEQISQYAVTEQERTSYARYCALLVCQGVWISHPATPSAR